MKTQLTKPIVFFFTSFFAFATLSSSVNADNFGIQIGAYKNLSEEALERANALGDLQTVQSGNFTRVLVGSYSSRKDAQAQLSSIQAKGYTDAFVTTINRSSSTQAHSHAVSASHNSSHVSSGHGHTHLPNHINSKLSGLSNEELSKAVILDGKLHFKEGDRFIPVN